MIQIWEGGWPAKRITQPNETNRKKLAAKAEKKMPATVNFDADVLVSAANMETLIEDLLRLVLQVVSGEVRTNAEVNRYFEMGIWHDGIIT